MMFTDNYMVELDDCVALEVGLSVCLSVGLRPEKGSFTKVQQ